jgi:hypothetical protein
MSVMAPHPDSGPAFAERCLECFQLPSNPLRIGFQGAPTGCVCSNPLIPPSVWNRRWKLKDFPPVPTGEAVRLENSKENQSHPLGGGLALTIARLSKI